MFWGGSAREARPRSIACQLRWPRVLKCGRVRLITAFPPGRGVPVLCLSGLLLEEKALRTASGGRRGSQGQVLTGRRGRAHSRMRRPRWGSTPVAPGSLPIVAEPRRKPRRKSNASPLTGRLVRILRARGVPAYPLHCPGERELVSNAHSSPLTGNAASGHREDRRPGFPRTHCPPPSASRCTRQACTPQKKRGTTGAPKQRKRHTHLPKSRVGVVHLRFSNPPPQCAPVQGPHSLVE